MNTDKFLNYESDVAKAGGFAAMPPMHQQAYEIIKEASFDFTDWETFSQIADDPDISKLVSLHMEWLSETLAKKHVESHIIVAKPEPQKREKKDDDDVVFAKGTPFWFKYQGEWYNEPLSSDVTKHDLTARFSFVPKTSPNSMVRMVHKVPTKEIYSEHPDDLKTRREAPAPAVKLPGKPTEKAPKAKPVVAKFVKFDSWSRPVYQAGDEMYVEVDGKLHTRTAQGEPNYPVHHIKWTPKKPKAQKKPKAKKALPKVSGGEPKYGDDVRFIRSFLNLHNNASGTGTEAKRKQLSFYKRMGKANAEKRFHGSKYKPELNAIVAALHEAITNKNPLTLDTAVLSKLENIKNEHALSLSVQIIKSFFNMIGAAPKPESVDLLLKKIERVDESDSNYAYIRRIKHHLEESLKNPRRDVSLDEPTIEGLAGVLRGCGCKFSGTWEGVRGKKA